MRNIFVFLITLLIGFVAKSQEKYEPLFSLSDYNYCIYGELELNYESDIHFKPQYDQAAYSKVQAKYNIRTPIVITFNRNDLLFFNKQPKIFLGEEPDKTLISTPTYTDSYYEQEPWMKVEAHTTSVDAGISSVMDVTFEAAPVMQISFNFLKWFNKLKEGQKDFTFQLDITGKTTSYTSYRNIRGTAKFDDLIINEFSDVPINIGCGVFYQFDYADALMANYLEDANKKVQQKFEQKFWVAYFKNLPEIPSTELLNFLIHPEGNFEVPFSGSFNSDTKHGSQKVTMNGKISLDGKSVKKD